MKQIHEFSEILPYERSYWVVPGKLIAGHLPSAQNGNIEDHLDRLNRLIDVNISLVINLMEENEIGHNGLPLWDYREPLIQLALKRNHEINVVRIPVPDLGIPSSPSAISEILDLIDQYNASGKIAYIHCWGGIGRTGTVVGCYLLRHRLADKSNVLHFIQYLRRTTPYADRPSPETEEQRNFILNWPI